MIDRSNTQYVATRRHDPTLGGSTRQQIDAKASKYSTDFTIQSMNPLRLLQQLLNLEILHISPRKHPHQLALPSTRLSAKVIEALHTTHQPGSLGCRDTTVRHDLSMHQDKTLVIS